MVPSKYSHVREIIIISNQAISYKLYTQVNTCGFAKLYPRRNIYVSEQGLTISKELQHYTLSLVFKNLS